MDEVTRVLLVEDNDYDVHRVEKALAGSETTSFNLAHESTLVDAVERVEEDAPDIVLLDLGLPDSDGLDTLDVFHDHAPDLPVVVLTGLRDEEVALKAVRSGAHDYIVKDHLDTFNLVHAIRFALERQQFAKEAESALRGLVGGEGSAASALIVGVANEVRASTSEIASALAEVRDALDAPRTGDPAVAQASVSEATDKVARIDQLLKVLVRFFGTRAKGEAVSLHEPTVAAVYLFHSASAHRVGVDADLSPTPAVDVEGFRLQRMVMDLLEAASGAVPDGTVLTVETVGENGSARLAIRTDDVETGDLDLDDARRVVDGLGGSLAATTGDGLEIAVRFPTVDG